LASLYTSYGRGQVKIKTRYSYKPLFIQLFVDRAEDEEGEDADEEEVERIILEKDYLLKEPLCSITYRKHPEECDDAESQRVALEGKLAMHAHPLIELFCEPLDVEEQIQLISRIGFFHPSSIQKKAAQRGAPVGGFLAGRRGDLAEEH
jgi:hypothetical protein